MEMIRERIGKIMIIHGVVEDGRGKGNSSNGTDLTTLDEREKNQKNS